VLGYELLFRESPQEERFNADLQAGTRSIIDTLNVMGLDAVCDGRGAFINCSHDMLLKGFFQLLPAEKAVVEIQENLRARHIPANQASQLRLLKAISAPEVDFDAVEALIKQDASLRYRLLRYLSSPFSGSVEYRALRAPWHHFIGREGIGPLDTDGDQPDHGSGNNAPI
jgi:c-di-GMP-related signal transduction protein